MDLIQEAEKAGKHGLAILKNSLVKNGAPKNLVDTSLSLVKKTLEDKPETEIEENEISDQEHKPGINQEQDPEVKDQGADPEPVQEQDQDPPEPENQDKDQDEPAGLSIWNDNKKQNKEDSGIADNLKNIHSEGERSVTKTLEDQPDSEFSDEIIKRKADKARAGMHIEIMDMGFCLICCIMHWTFTIEEQRKWKLDPDRKAEMKDTLFQVYSSSRKVVNPSKSFWVMVLGAYGLNFVIAVFSAIGRYNKRKEEKEVQARLQLQHRHNELQYLETGNFKPVEYQPVPPAPVQPVQTVQQTTETVNQESQQTVINPDNPLGHPEPKKTLDPAQRGQGRHKKDCKCGNCEWSNPKKKKKK